jgi:hemolysin D
MSARIITIDDCRPLRQSLEARPPMAIHGTALLLFIILGGALVWAALTPVNLVVRATGRVRSTAATTQVFAPAATKLEGRIAAVYFQEGDRVTPGAVLLQLNTERLDNAGEELAKLDELATKLDQQFHVAQAKADAECQQVQREIERAKSVQDSDVRRAAAELRTAQDHHERTVKLAANRNATAEALVEAESKWHDAEEKLAAAHIPVDESRAAVLEQARALVREDYEVKYAELEARRVAKQGEREAAHKDLANLQLQHEQATLRAPLAGIVTKGRYRVGDLVEAGKAVFEIASDDAFLFEAAVGSEDVGLLRDDMESRIKFDAYDFQRYGTLAGRVSFIAPDSVVSSEQQSTKGSTYLVRVAFDGREIRRDELCGHVKLGMAGTVEIVTDRRSVLSILVKRIRSSVSLG